MNNTTLFRDDLYEGLKKEEIFISWSYLHSINLTDKRKEKLGYDFIMNVKGKERKVDVKSYGKEGYLPIEEMHNGKQGSIYSTDADMFCFIGHGKLIFLFIKPFREWWKVNKDRYEIRNNQPTQGYYEIFQSSFRYVPMNDIINFIGVKEYGRTTKANSAIEVRITKTT